MAWEKGNGFRNGFRSVVEEGGWRGVDGRERQVRRERKKKGGVNIRLWRKRRGLGRWGYQEGRGPR